MLAIWVVEGLQYGNDNLSKPSPEVGQNISVVVAAAAKYGEEGVADGACEAGSRQAAVCLQPSGINIHVPLGRLLRKTP